MTRKTGTILTLNPEREALRCLMLQGRELTLKAVKDAALRSIPQGAHCTVNVTVDSAYFVQYDNKRPA